MRWNIGRMQLFQKRLSLSIFDTRTERSFGYCHKEFLRASEVCYFVAVHGIMMNWSCTLYYAKSCNANSNELLEAQSFFRSVRYQLLSNSCISSTLLLDFHGLSTFVIFLARSWRLFVDKFKTEWSFVTFLWRRTLILLSLENHTLKGSTSPYSICIGVPPPGRFIIL